MEKRISGNMYTIKLCDSPIFCERNSRLKLIRNKQQNVINTANKVVIISSI
jgi:hypothetical protein